MSIVDRLKEIEKEARSVCRQAFGNEDCWKIFAEDIYQRKKQELKEQ